MVEAYEADALTLSDRIAQCAGCKPDTAVQGIPCAVCDDAMALRRIDGVEIDVCIDHGTWFDAQELRLVAEAMAEARRRRFQQGFRGAVQGPRGTKPAKEVKAVSVVEGLDVAVESIELGVDAADIAEGAFEVVGGILGGLFEL
jgi:hypothetical protein